MNGIAGSQSKSPSYLGMGEQQDDDRSSFEFFLLISLRDLDDGH